MNARAKRRLKKWMQIATAAWLMFAVAFDVYASESVDVLEQHVTEDTAYLYLRYSGEAQSAGARIGTEAVDHAAITGGDSIPIVTWLLMDNSISISNADREKGKELLVDLVAGKAANERFNLCTYSEHLNVLLEDCQSYADLKSRIDRVESNNQESFLTDVLAELLDAEKQREDQAYVRVVVICDGVDNNPEGLTREELNMRLSAGNIPIYTFGCKSKGNEALLKELYSLSRQTGAKSWTLSELEDTLEAVKIIGGEEIPVCAAVAGLAAFLLLRKKNRQIEPVKEPFAEPNVEKTDILDKSPSRGGTMILVENDSRLILCLTDCANPDRHFEVPLRGKVSIGRSSGNQIVLDYDKSISGRHCEIFIDGKTFKLRDLHSSNGTMVDGLRVADVAEIANGSTIKLGRREFTVKIR